MNLDRLKEVLGITTYFAEDKNLADYLEKVLTEKGYTFEIEVIEYPAGRFAKGKEIHHNIYVTKGEAEYYPCFVSHIDTVHHIDDDMIVIEDTIKDQLVLTGINSETEKPSGIGGDDKCGVYLCLEMLDKLDNVKIAFFGGEEYGMAGSKQLNEEFFKDVGYAIQFDSPQGNSMSMSLSGVDLFNKDSIFGEIVSGPILEHGIDKWERHPYTDVYQIITKTHVSCLNLAAGYHRYHRPDEYVVIDEVQNTFELAVKLHSLLGETLYIRKRSESELRFSEDKRYYLG